MEFNEYQPVSHDPASQVPALDVLEAYKEGWLAFLENIGKWLAVGVVGYIVIIVSAMTFIGMFLVLPLIFWGYVRFTLNTIDGYARFEDLFSGFNDFGRNWARMSMLLFVFFVVSLAVSIVTSILGVINPLLGSIISFLAWTVLSFAYLPRLVCTPFLIVEQEYSAIDAIKKSWQVSEHCNVQLIGLFVSFSLGSFICYLPLAFMAGPLLKISEQVTKNPSDPMALIAPILESALSFVGLFSLSMILITALSIIFYGAAASAYRQLTSRTDQVESAL